MYTHLTNTKIVTWGPAGQCLSSSITNTASCLTYEACEGVHHQAGAHDQQKVAGWEVSFHALVEAIRQLLTKEHNVRLHKAPA
jgi:hypothetical protein